IKHLENGHDCFLNWEMRAGTTPKEYDVAYAALFAALQPYSLRGWHCTRLTDREIDGILQHGMQMPNADMLSGRIAALVSSNDFSLELAESLQEENEADEANRAGMLHFIFYMPNKIDEGGIGRFFRHWGGEALYNCHEDDP